MGQGQIACNYELSRSVGDMSILTQARGLRSTEHPATRSLWSPHCLLCGAACTHDEPVSTSRSDLLCPACQADLPGLPRLHCPICLCRTTHGERCGTCLHRPPAYSDVTALFAYDFPVDRLIQAMKYGHQLLLADWFGNNLAEKLRRQTEECGGIQQIDRIVPMPLHPTRLRERGFNQALELSRPLEKRLNIPVDRKILIRQRPTPPQAQLALKERAGNVKGAFACLAPLHGQTVLLIDDVLTTGNTADECARVLRRNGAAQVRVAVIARALKD